ncbi:MAG TPA: hypothetical protein PLP34_06670 [Chitinophagaceae bacterium]|nr:hypothetical protein [Chitinophagaceae bacterium]
MSLSLHQSSQLVQDTLHQYKHLYFVRDLFLVPLCLAILFTFLKIYRRHLDPDIQPYLFRGFLLKLVLLPLFLFHHTFIYTGGVDQFTYYWCSNEIIQLFYIHPAQALQIVFSSYSEFSLNDLNFEMSHFIFAPNESFVIKLTSVLSFLTGNSFLVTSLLLSFFSYFGCWKIFMFFHKAYPGHARLFAYSCIYIPSVAFWSSVISKEVYCIGAMGFLFSAIMDIHQHRKIKGYHFILLPVMAYLLIRIKLYILLALLIALLFYLLISWLKKIRHPLLRVTALPLLLILFSAIVYFFGNTFESQLEQFAFSNILNTIKVNYDYLTQENFASSRYTLGTIEPTLGSISKLVPASINVTLFRPYIWEANKPITLLAALESLLTLFITLYVVFKVRLRIFRFIFRDRILMFALIFSLTFAAAVGLTSGNFGTLMRYKIPLMLFYFPMLAVLYILHRSERKGIPETEALC